MASKFMADIKGFADTTVKNMRADAAEGINRVVEGMQTPARGISKGGALEVGKIPVADAELINSLTSEGVEGKDSYVTAIAGFEIGDVMSFAYTAPYAHRKEVGFVGTDSSGREFSEQGWHFMGTNARKFPQHIADIVKART